MWDPILAIDIIIIIIDLFIEGSLISAYRHCSPQGLSLVQHGFTLSYENGLFD